MAKKGAKLSAAAERHVQRLIHAHNNPAFEGALEFDLTLEMFGQRVTRRARAVYQYTPEWRHWDPRKKALAPGVGSSVYSLQLLAVPEELHEDGTITDGTPGWIETRDFVEDGVLPIGMRDAILDAIDAQCRTEDAKRRKAAGLS